jgi:hypothetical protein
MLQNIEHDHARAVGGFWIRPDGSSVPVTESEGHMYTLRSLCDSGELPEAGYCVAYKHGWVRVSFCSAGTFIGTFQRVAAVPALRTLASLMRLYKCARAHARVEVCADYDAPQHDPIRALRRHNWHAFRALHPEWEDETDTVAKKVMALAMEKAKAERTAKQVAEAYAASCRPVRVHRPERIDIAA